MQITLGKALVALAIGASGAAATSQQQAINECANDLYVFLNASGSFTGPITLAPGATYTTNIVGTGDSLAVAKSTDYYSSGTPKFVLGTSTSGGTIYWSVNNVDGNPFPSKGFSVTSANDACGSTSSYGSTVYTCPDDDQVLTATLC